jgi:hypothetical protein
MECNCDDIESNFLCKRNLCPVPCPITKPNVGDSCARPFRNESCSYTGELCCPGEEGNCIKDQICICDFESLVSCTIDTTVVLPCPSVCPKVPPGEGDVCDIDVRYACGYGDAVVCDDTTVSSEYEKVCMCGVNGTFSCESFECPVPCPDTPLLEEGAPCSPFVGDGYCSSGEFCCPGEGEKCIPEKKCSCVSSADGERTIKCENYSDFFDAEIIECPSVCPKTPPANGDVCDIDYRIQCVYGDAVICDGDPDYMFPYENEMLL